jgi:hypothetical protein
MLIYLVSDGCYSGYTIHAIFADKDAAKDYIKYARLDKYAEIEEYELITKEDYKFANICPKCNLKLCDKCNACMTVGCINYQHSDWMTSHCDRIINENPLNML